LNKQDANDCLKNISINVDDKTLLAIVGTVGSGKSSLLMALLGEMPCVKGLVNVNGSIFYASQEPWIFSATIRQNILFGKDYNEKKFKQIVEVCCLKDASIQEKMCMNFG
jgi:ATP-binding cassette subfamily C (CFTR/MRP) protein 4